MCFCVFSVRSSGPLHPYPGDASQGINNAVEDMRGGRGGAFFRVLPVEQIVPRLRCPLCFVWKVKVTSKFFSEKHVQLVRKCKDRLDIHINTCTVLTSPDRDRVARAPFSSLALTT